MARPREFDEDTVLEAAMRCFWAQGYDATSVRDLAAEMGITGASLYNAFGDKRSLYRRAWDRYLTHSVHDRMARLSDVPPLAAIAGFFDEIVERSVADDQRRGCLLVNSAMEVALRDAAFGEMVSRELTTLEGFFQRCVAAGQQDGTITRRQSANSLAKLLLSVLLGVRVLARARPERDVLAGAVTALLELLRPEP